MKTRNWSIRSKIVALVAVPLTALLALWIFATSLTVGPAFRLLSAQTLLDTVARPGEVLVAELQKERRLSVVFLSSPAETSSPPVAAPNLITQRAATDRAIAGFRAAAGGENAQDAADQTLRDRIRQMFADLDGLPANRGHIDAREVDVVGAQGMYNAIVDTGFSMFSAIARFDDQQIDRELRGLHTVSRGQEFLSRSDSLLAGANTAGVFRQDVRDELMKAILTARFLLAEGVTDMPAGERTTYRQLSNSQAFSRLAAMQDSLITSGRAGAASPVTIDSWQPAYDTSVQHLRAFEINATDALAERAAPVAVGVLVRLGVAGLLGLIALVVSIVVSVRMGRSIIGRLGRLRGEALEMAGARLPTVVRRLQRGEEVDVDVETPPLEYGNDEIGELGQAFNEVQRTAVQSAVEEAGVRRGINEVFLNIARRSQSLLHRQLALLDRMERRETKPDELEDLYRVDHLATRMRRHAEDLVILAGAAPGRGWRNPVPVIDVIRGAISEVEDYKRIDVQSVEQSAVLGRAVGDVIHLLAELLENAASFSPPTTRVHVTGQALPNGYALEIEDRGLGMSSETLDQANRKLAEPPDFDPKDSARLGLFVVSQLAHRNGIKVSLRASVYGGVTAVVLVPGELITTAHGPMELPAGPSEPERSWDKPLVGTGRDDADRRSLAALQWHGGDAASVAARGHRVTLNGSGGPAAADGDSTMPLSRRPTGGGVFGGAVPKPRTPAGEPSAEPAAGPAAGPAARRPTAAEPAARRPTSSGPTPSTIAEGLSAEGLVRRRRTVPRQPLAAPDRPAGAPPPSAAAPPESASLPVPAAPPDEPAVPKPAGPPQPAGTTADGLPRRIRQASLAPQLRNTPVDDQADSQQLRSPDQVRTIMSALQRGTTRGRMAAAAGDGPDGQAPGIPQPGNRKSGNGRSGNGTSARQLFSEAATVILPIVRDQHHGNNVTWPDKDDA